MATIGPAVPELPDLVVVSEALHAGLAGRPIVAARSLAPLAVRGTPAELAALEGQRLIRIGRRGKFILIDLERDRIAVNAMLTGRFQLAEPSAPLPPRTALVLTFGERPRAPADAATWTKGARWLPANGDR